MIKAIIFDFDGLILDTETPEYEIYRQMFEELGAQLPLEQWVKGIGTIGGEFNVMDYLEQQIGSTIDRVLFSEQARTKHLAHMDGIDIRPGVLHYLQAAKRAGLRIGLATSSSRSWVEKHLNKYNLLSYFEVIRTRDDVVKVKPDPELYVQALEHLGVKATEAIVFEDSLNGLRAAKAAGIYCVIVPNDVTKQLNFTMHDLRLSSMEDMSLEEIINKLTN